MSKKKGLNFKKLLVSLLLVLLGVGSIVFGLHRKYYTAEITAINKVQVAKGISVFPNYARVDVKYTDEEGQEYQVHNLKIRVLAEADVPEVGSRLYVTGHGTHIREYSMSLYEKLLYASVTLALINMVVG